MATSMSRTSYLGWADVYKKFKVEMKMTEIDAENEHWDEIFPISVSFHNPLNEKIETFDVLDAITDRNLIPLKLKEITDFDWEITYDWSSLSSCLEKARYRKPGSFVKKFPWQSSSETDIFPEQGGEFDRLWELLVNAISSDFNNADIRRFCHALCEHIRLHSQDVMDFMTDTPFPTSKTNSSVAIIYPQDNVDNSDIISLSSSSPKSSVCSLPRPFSNPGPCVVVPDVVVCHCYKQLFVLNIKCKRPSDNINKTVVQCLKQMLSQMHAQDLHFGMVFSPLEWRLLVLHKTPSGLHIYQHSESLVSVGLDEYTLNVPSVIQGFNWIYRVMCYRIQENIRLGNKRKSADVEVAI